MKQKNENAPRPGGAGRKPKADPAVFRYSISFNAIDHARFLALFDQSGMRTKAHFITARIFGEPFKVIKIDKAAVEYYTRLTAILRTYIEKRYGFNAMEMTSTEIIDRLLKEQTSESLDELRMLFQLSLIHI